MTNVPEDSTKSRHPVIIALHGFHEGAHAFMNVIRENLAGITSTHIIVSVEAGRCGWNVANITDCAWHHDDVSYVSYLMDRLAQHANVLPRYTLFGFSQGAALLNRILIENDDPRIVAAVSWHSQLNTLQYHDGSFHSFHVNNRHRARRWTLVNRAVLQLSDSADKVIPSSGGRTVIAVQAHGGNSEGRLSFRLSFHAWDASALRLASCMARNRSSAMRKAQVVFTKQYQSI